MPATSEKQKKLMGAALSYKRGKNKNASKEVKELASSMSEQKLKDYAQSNDSHQKKSMEIARYLVKRALDDHKSEY